jgi:hypothetical protein
MTREFQLFVEMFAAIITAFAGIALWYLKKVDANIEKLVLKVAKHEVKINDLDKIFCKIEDCPMRQPRGYHNERRSRHDRSEMVDDT